MKIKGEDIKPLVAGMGSCIASSKITIEGLAVGYMYRERPDFDGDTGWRFFSGTEDQEYVDDYRNSMIYDVNTIANYDATIIPYLILDYGSELEKKGDIFIEV